MPINRPRRIFRPAIAPLRPRAIGAVLLAVALGAGGLGLANVPWLTQGSAAPHVAASADLVDAQPAQVAVVDGGTLRLRDRVVRLLGVDSPVRGATCRTRDGAGFDCGAAATNALAALVREVPVACRLTGQDELGRPYAVCEASGTELNRAVIASGWARADDTQPALKRDEEMARVERRGLWAARDTSW